MEKFRQMLSQLIPARALPRERTAALMRAWVVSLIVLGGLDRWFTYLFNNDWRDPCTVFCVSFEQLQYLELLLGILFVFPLALAVFTKRYELKADLSETSESHPFFLRASRFFSHAVLFVGLAITTTAGVFFLSWFFYIAPASLAICDILSFGCMMFFGDMGSWASMILFDILPLLSLPVLLGWTVTTFVKRDAVLLHTSLEGRVFSPMDFIPFQQHLSPVFRRIAILGVIACWSVFVLIATWPLYHDLIGIPERTYSEHAANAEIMKKCPESAKLLFRKYDIDRVSFCEAKDITIDGKQFSNVTYKYPSPPHSGPGMPIPETIYRALVDSSGNIYDWPSAPLGVNDFERYIIREYGEQCSNIRSGMNLVLTLDERGAPVYRLASMRIDVTNASFPGGDAQYGCHFSADIVLGDDGVYRLQNISVTHQVPLPPCGDLSTPNDKGKCWDTEEQIERNME